MNTSEMALAAQTQMQQTIVLHYQNVIEVALEVPVFQEKSDLLFVNEVGPL